MIQRFVPLLFVVLSADAFSPAVNSGATSKAPFSTYLESLSVQTATHQQQMTETHPQFTEERSAFGTFINVTERVAQSTFAIDPESLVDLAKDVLRTEIGVTDEDVLADNFKFCAPVIGPINKEEYLQTLRSFDLQGAFPDIDTRVHNIHVDPFEHNRVWFQSRPIATHTGPLFGGKATGKKLRLPPQMNSLMFDEEGKVKQLTVGYVLDRRVGNTGGLGGAFGFFYGVGQGLPIPECKPFKRSLRYRLLTTAAGIGMRLRRVRRA